MAQPLNAPGQDPTGGEPRKKRRAPVRSPFEGSGLRDRAPVFSLPPGHRATVEKNSRSDAFLGESFAMDSQEFLVWLSKYFPTDILALRVILFLMGTQEPGGLVKATQQHIGDELDVERVHVNRVLGALYRVGIVHMVRRGVYQLNPRATLRGGTLVVNDLPTPFAGQRKAKMRVDQLELISALDLDPKVAEEFKELVLPKPPPPKQRKRGRTSSDEGRREG
ncbi:helix-turn-helix domain-containing protein [Streptomyces sp. Isolate_45]|uniref:helix-turn-helix domain-containing protein n=1 Tax=Streptomyces sp. Isolate_45 TaxID=2950111 RepID=UPI002481ED3A|nr:helix-turn-helix domain-containing protein [Streptomyces sp. Isolate_45]MDA5279942.1 hypothetical protein [Streptomyces sp. Isolate_45]